ncbi:MAG: hypothetical protein A2W31_06410 [Planctomycetes bacterium RBG_16_64_10]|nr:MAG: hypothetical protein A2W31_06410 [Planctomycetes bacterium RBG_16_64_10]
MLVGPGVIGFFRDGGLAMKRSLLVCVFLTAHVGWALADESKTVAIPLDQIWAWRMPGTRDIGQLEPNKPAKVACGPLVGEIRKALSATPANGKEAKPGFAVLGTGLKALRGAHAVLVKNKNPQDTFPANSEISVVFFSYQFGPYVHLEHVKRRDNVVDIAYEFVPHRTEEVTEHLALIPVGNLSSGKYYVKVDRASMEQKNAVQGFRPTTDTDARRIICHSFDFTVLGNKDH